MARIRTIKPEFWTDEKIVSLPYVARLFFIGLWNFADDYGALQDKPEQLKLLVMPSEKGIDSFQIIDLLNSSDLIERYIDDETDSSFLLIKNWSSHQKVDHPTKSKIIKTNAKKASIPQQLRRSVAEKYGCKPGESISNECYSCGTKGLIYWTRKIDGTASGWVTFSHELSHFVPENEGGKMDVKNVVLCCRNCNRSMGTKNAFDWIINGSYSTNQFRQEIVDFRDKIKEFEKTHEDSITKGMERNGKYGSVKDSANKNLDEIIIQSPKNKKKEKDISPGPENWNTRPGSEEMDLELPEIKAGSIIELFKITRNLDVGTGQIIGLWSVFKAQYFGGEKFYQSKNEVYKHFFNWCKTQTIKNGNDIKSPGTDYSKFGKSAGAIRAAHDLSKELGIEL